MADITMPQLGETVTEGTITKWFKQVGDEIGEDEVLFEVSTDKVDSEVPAPTSGYITEILVQEGETVDVGTKLAVIGDSPPSGGDGGAPATEANEKPSPKAEPTEEPAEQPIDDAAAAEPEETQAAAAAEEEKDKEEPEEAAAEDEAEPEQNPEPEPEPEREPEPKPKAAKAAEAPSRPEPAATSVTGTDGKLLSPVVRRLIAEHNLDPNTIEGTGAGGRITRNDVLAVIEKGTVAKRDDGGPAPAPAPEQPAARTGPSEQPAAAATRPAPEVTVRAGERDSSIPLSNIRRRTAEHMIRSLETSAHVYASIEVDFEGVEAVRRARKESWKAEEGFSLTYLPFISRAVVDAIREFPEVNASLGENELVIHNYVNLGIAVDLDFKGLIVPVIRDADGKRLRAIAREVADLARRARAKKLSADEIAGGTFTITNPGPFGTLLTLPIINQPQVAILSTDGVKRRPVVVTAPDGSEAIAIHSVGNLALTWDHRAFDGAYASSFLAKVRQIVETRDWSSEI